VDAPTARFSAARAHALVRELSDGFGVRTLGSEANDRAGDWVWSRVSRLAEEGRARGLNVELDRWRSSGDFEITRLSEKVHVFYSDVENIAVKVCGKASCSEGSEGSAVLINSHYDSAINSPGGSDAAGMIGIMLEILSNVIHDDKRLLRPVIFLFNGGEEPFLLAAHAFLAHRWWKLVGAFINLESSGAGGSALLFRVGHEQPWLIDAYRRAVKHPHVFCASQDVFERELIPSDTDFKIFSTVAGVPGYDFANYRHGQIYHTNRDTAGRCTESFLQHMGENAEALLRELAGDSDPIENARRMRGQHRPKTIIFDLLGQVSVSYSEAVGNAVYFLVFVLLLRKLSLDEDRGQVRRAALGLAAGMVTGVGGGALVGLVLSALKPLAWYGHFWLTTVVFGAPGLLICFALAAIFTGGRRMSAETTLLGLAVVYGFIAAGFALARLRMTYMPALYTLGALLGTLTKGSSGSVLALKFAVCMAFVFAVGMPPSLAVVEVFTATMGRSGVDVPADVIIGGLVAFLVVSQLATLVCIALCTHRFRRGLVGSLLAVACAALTFLLVQKCAYNEEYPKRVVAIDANFHNESHRSGLYVTGLDSVPLGRYGGGLSGEFVGAADAAKWGKLGSFVFDTWTFRAQRLVASGTLRSARGKGSQAELALSLSVLKDEVNSGTRTLSFTLSCPGATSVTMKLDGNVRAYAFLSLPQKRGTLERVRVHMAKDRPLQWTLELEPPGKLVVDVTASSEAFTPQMYSLNDSMADWEALVGGQAAFASHTL